jgi:hypothetical protein
MKPVTFFYILGLIFITLKLMHYINWSWWLVLAPFYIYTLAVLTICVIVGIIYFFLQVLGH